MAVNCQLIFVRLLTLADQTILISSLLSGFSITVAASLMVKETKNRFVDYTFKAAIVSAACFLVSVFAWTSILLMSSKDYPIGFTESDFTRHRIIGGLSLALGVMALSALLSFSGWIKSRGTGIFTTIIGVLTFLIIAYMST